MLPPAQYRGWPGGDLVREGLNDLAAGRTSIPALLVAVGAPRLRRAGIEVPRRRLDRAEHRLYALLARSDPDSAHSRYNALIRRLVSFERAIECVG
jgi:hypothetical protein